MPRSLHVRADRRLLHAEARSRRQLRVDVVAPRGRPRTTLSLGLVLDRSGSMAGDKLQLAREGAIRAVQALRPEDRLSLVAYSDGVQMLIRSGAADEPARRIAEQRLRQLDAGGNTDLCAGWLRGCEQVGLGLEGGPLGRCLLLTDGLANLGITDRGAIVGHAAELRSRGVTTSTLGVGCDFDEVLLREMAEKGGGNFYFAERATQLRDIIAGETGEAVKVVARDAAVVLDLPEGASVTSPNPLHIRTEQTRSVVELGDLVEDQVLSLVVTLEIPPGKEGERVPVQCWLWDPGGVLEGSADLELRYAGRGEYRAEPRDRDVDREVVATFGTLRSKEEDGLTLGTMTFTCRTLNLMMEPQLRVPDRTSFHVIAVTADKEGTRLVESAGQALVAANARAFSWSVVDGGARILDPGPGVALSRDDELGLAYALAGAGDAVKVAFVRGLLEDDAPAHWYAGENGAIVSLSAWSGTAGVPPAAFVACQMVLQSLRQKTPGWDPSVPVHPDARQCWGDTGDGHADLEGKIRAGGLCPSCRKLFGEAGVDVDGVLGLLGAVRGLAERPAGTCSGAM